MGMYSTAGCVQHTAVCSGVAVYCNLYTVCTTVSNSHTTLDRLLSALVSEYYAKVAPVPTRTQLCTV